MCHVLVKCCLKYWEEKERQRERERERVMMKRGGKANILIYVQVSILQFLALRKDN
jgi:hypothetical protein